MPRPVTLKIKAFTLVELLVVIAVIALLMGILLPVLSAFMESGRKSACTSDLQQLTVNLGIYEQDYRDYPPSTLAPLGITGDNNINSGGEGMVVSLSNNGKGAPYQQFDEEKLENSDMDFSPVSLQKLGSYFAVNALWEFIDPWGNPVIYFHHRDLIANSQQFYMLQGTKTQVAPNLTKNKTGNVAGQGNYQITACGADGIANTEDDIMSQGK